MSRVLTLAFVAVLLTAQVASADQIGFDDFDVSGGPDQFTGTPNGDFTSRTITPDNSGNFGFSATPGVFGSFFDVFGITARTVGFDFADDSAGSFAPDDFGIVRDGDTDNFLGAADTVNGDNPLDSGTVNWTYDVSGFRNLSVSMDMAAIGNFDGDDSVTLMASIDGGTPQSIFSIAHSPGQLYTVTMEGGTTYDRYTEPSAFFVSNDWDAWEAASFAADFVAPSGDTLNPHEDDDGVTRGDSVAGDGFIAIIEGTAEERAYNDGAIDQSERSAYVEPLVVNGTTQLNNELQTLTFPIAGTGDELALELVIELNGSKEVFVLDDLLIEGDIDTGGPLADTDGDLDVDGTDFLDIQRNTPSLISAFQTEYGTQPPAVGAVPEPGSLVLVAMSICALGLRRKIRQVS